MALTGGEMVAEYLVAEGVPSFWFGKSRCGRLLFPCLGGSLLSIVWQLGSHVCRRCGHRQRLGFQRHKDADSKGAEIS